MRIEITDEYLYKIMPKVAELMMADIPDKPEMPFEPSSEFDKKMKKLIRKSKRPGRIKGMNHRLSRVACLVICMIAAGAVLTGTVLANEIMQMKLTERIVMDDGVMEYFEVSGEGVIKHLTYIPEGYELIAKDEDAGVEEYQNSKQGKIVYVTWVIEDGMMLFRDTEFVNSKNQVINGKDVTIGYKGNGTLKAQWFDENVYYLIEANSLNDTEIVKMIENIQ